MAAIGIDLGTTCSSAAIAREGRVEMITNESGSRSTPSIVAFVDDRPLVGDCAKAQASLNPLDTLFCIKRSLGQKIDDPEVVEKMQRHSSSLEPCFSQQRRMVFRPNNSSTVPPEQVVAIIIGKLKRSAENVLGKEVKNAVVCVPSSFNSGQRQAAIDSCALAGLTVRLLNETTAAAVAWGMSCLESESECHVLVLDVGGGSCDVALISVEDGTYAVDTTAGNARLGGEDMDDRMVQHCLASFKAKHDDDLSKNAVAVRRLRTACERAKRQLSITLHTTIELACLHNGIDFHLTISRDEFEAMVHDLLQQCIRLVDEVCTSTHLAPHNIHEILLLGGCAHIPKLRALLSDYLNLVARGKELNTSVQLTEAVAYGAAIVAHDTYHNSEPSLTFLVFEELTRSIGIEQANGRVQHVVRRNTARGLPCHVRFTLTTHYDFQTEITACIYEGESAHVQENSLLGRVRIQGLQPAYVGAAQVELCMVVDESGVVHVEAKDMTVGKPPLLNVTLETARLTASERESAQREVTAANLDLQAREERCRAGKDASDEVGDYTCIRIATD